MAWTDNSAMFWDDAGKWEKVTDHNRTPISISVERIENKQRMANGTLRRYSVAKKHTFTTSWDMLPSKNGVSGAMGTADGGWAGMDIENFHNRTNGAFQMQLRRGDGSIETFTVMITDFSKEIQKRGPGIDFWNLDITLEEV